MYAQFEELLTHWDFESTLVILGDVIDRGPHSYEVVRKLMELKEQYGEQVVVCVGNHEIMLIEYIGDPIGQEERYIRNGGVETLKSFLAHAPEEAMSMPPHEAMLTFFQEELAFLQSGLLYKLIDKLLFTHAGFTHSIEQTSANDFVWIRKHYEQPNDTGYVNIFGHTPVIYIHETPDIWVNEDNGYIGVDGGCYMTGQLNGLFIRTDGEILDKVKVSGQKAVEYD